MGAAASTPPKRAEVTQAPFGGEDAAAPNLDRSSPSPKGVTIVRRSRESKGLSAEKRNLVYAGIWMGRILPVAIIGN